VEKFTIKVEIKSFEKKYIKSPIEYYNTSAWLKFFFFYNLFSQSDENIYIYNICALSKHIGNMCMRLRNGGKGEEIAG
jgi:hypothetical protein